VVGLDLPQNNLVGTITNEIGKLTNIRWMDLSRNHLSGSIPSSVGDIECLTLFHLQSNSLTGEIPDSLLDLYNLFEDLSDIRWNGLFSNSENLTQFLNMYHVGGDWQSTQTIAPGDMESESAADGSITLFWNPIEYQADPGGYEVWHSPVSGGIYEFFGITDDKTISKLTVEGLSPGMDHYFVVQTMTDSHVNNPNPVRSDPSQEVAGFSESPLPSLSPWGIFLILVVIGWVLAVSRLQKITDLH